MPTNPITIKFTGGMNNRHTPIDLFQRQMGECQSLINADTSLAGRLKLLRPLTALNTTAESSSIHSIFRANDTVLVGTGTSLKYQTTTTLTSLLTGLSGKIISFAHAGQWVFLGDGTNNRSVYLATPVGCSWGINPPSAAPTVADSGTGGNPDGTYICYYRYKITMPDASVLYSGLSPSGTVTVATNKIAWSGLVHASFTGATTVAIELFRTSSAMAATYLVTEIASGTTTYTDDETDATIEASVEFDEEGYYGPPAGVEMAIYHAGSDRVFCAVDNNVYWSEAAMYHVFVYDETADSYQNVNSVFLTGENVTGLLMFDEQLYIGSAKTWRRLRGTNPDYWSWEPIAGAIKGPVAWRTLVTTQYGAIYPGNDGHLWIFNGFETVRIAEHFVFPTDPSTTAHATFDGRFYRLFYEDPTNPLFVMDFFEFPRRPPRVVQSSQSATASHYDAMSNKLYYGDSNGYLRNGEDITTSVTLSFLTAEIPIEQLVNLGNAASLLVHMNTHGINMTITPYYDNEAQTALATIHTDLMERVALPLPWNIYREISFHVTISTSEDIEIREPWMIRGEDDSTRR
jgi:hypothetical protein